MIRLAIIGAGQMGEYHSRVVNQCLSGARLQAICDTSLSRAKEVANAHDVQDVSTDPLATIARSDVDAVIVASPDFTHAELSKACIDAGKPVLCEKPLSQSSKDCKSVMSLEQAADRHFVMLGFMRRYDQSYMEIKQALQSGQLGRALMMHNFHRNVETPAADFTGSMAITNSAPHEFDVVRHVLGTEFTSVSAHQPRRSDSRVAPVVMMMETEDDQLVMVEINNNAAYGYDVRAELVGEKGSIAINNVSYTRTDLNLASSTRYDADWRHRYHEAYVSQNLDFLRFVKSGALSETASNAWDGYCAAIVAETGVKALESGQKQIISLGEKPKFYQTCDGAKA